MWVLGSELSLPGLSASLRLLSRLNGPYISFHVEYRYHTQFHLPLLSCAAHQPWLYSRYCTKITAITQDSSALAS